MMLRRTFVWMLAAFLLCAPVMTAAQAPFKPEAAVKDSEYDRLDGTGRSGKEVHVIEWEGNIELRAKPVGSLVGLAVVIDDKNKKNSALVFGYRFDIDAQTQLIRRAPMTTPIKPGFRVYKDRAEKEEDHFIITNQVLKDKNLIPFKLDPEPAQRYPSGHPLSGIPVEDGRTSPAVVVPPAEPAPAAPIRGKAPASEKASPSHEEDSGAIRSFNF